MCKTIKIKDERQSNAISVQHQKVLITGMGAGRVP